MPSYYNWEVSPFTWTEMNGLYVIDNDFGITLDDKEKKYRFKLKKGLLTDGGSIPFMLRWFAKGWTNDYRYNACYILHDGLYGSELLSKEQADDILRSSLRDCGLDRFHASTICWAVKTFAKSHYGRMKDDLDVASYIEFL